MFKLIAGATGVILLDNPELRDGVDKLGSSFLRRGLTPFKRSFVQESLNLGAVMFNTLKISIDLLPRDITLGLVTGKGEYFCDDCDEAHEFTVVQLGFFFFTVNITW